MVTLAPLNQLWQDVKQDLSQFRALFSDRERPSLGMHTFRLQFEGGQKRIHLRIEPSGDGVLFVDVSDVIHLNPTAAEMAYLALRHVPQAEAEAYLSRQIHPADRPQLAAELDQIYEMVARIQRPETGCPTCAVGELQRTALFSHGARAPYKADLALTYGCNNACAHCYNEPDRFTMPSLRADGWKKILDTLYEVGVPHIIFTGGEPTLHPDLPELINYADGLGQIVGMNSNGRYYSHAPFARKMARAGLNHLQITLGSNRPDVHNAIMSASAFHQTVQGIENAQAAGIHTITNTTLMRRNQDHVEEIIDFIYDLGVRTFAMNGMIYSGGGFADPNAIPEEEMPALLVRVRDHAKAKGMRFLWYTPTEYCRLSPVELELGPKRCNAGEYSICIEPNGDVLPCQSYYVTAGNVLHDSWDDIWHSDLFHSFRDRELDPAAAGLPEMCWECPDLPLCGGGCRIEREAREGNRVAESASCSSGGCSSGGCSTNGDGRSRSDKPKNGFIGLDTIAVGGNGNGNGAGVAKANGNGAGRTTVPLDTIQIQG